jgi:cell division protein FtsL
MIVVVIVVIAFVLYNMDKEYKQNIKRINELENKLNEYYKEREQRLKDNDLIK